MFTLLFEKNRFLFAMLLFLLSLGMHWSVFQKELVGVHLWRQAETQIVIRNFARQDFNIFNPRYDNQGNGSGIKRVEFPIMQWLIGATYRITGGSGPINSRVFTFVVGLFTVLGFYWLSYFYLRNRIAAGFAAWTFNFSPVFYYYTVNPLPDNFALCLSIWAWALFLHYKKTSKPVFLLSSAFLLSLGILTKLSYVLFAVPIFVEIFINLFLKADFEKKNTNIEAPNNKFFSQRARLISILPVYILALIPPALWYAWVIPTWSDRTGIIYGLLKNTPPIEEVLRILKGTLVSLLPELLLNYASVGFFLAGIFYFFRNKRYKSNDAFIIGCFLLAVLAYYTFEIHLIDLVHDYYLFPFLPILFLVVAYGAFELWNSPYRILRYFVVLAFIVAPVTCYLRIQTRWNLNTLGIHKPLVDRKENIHNLIPQDALCVMGSDISTHIMPYLTDKKGWVISANQINYQTLMEFAGQGAQYLIANENLNVDSTIENTLIFHDKGLRIFKIK